MAKLAWVKHGGRRIYFPRDPYSGCDSKRRYDTELAGRMGAQATISNPRHRGPALLWVYPCLACHGWHVTSSGLQKGAAVTATQLWQGVNGIPAEISLPLQQKASR